MMSWIGNLMILGGMIPLCEGVRLHFNSIQGMAMDRSSFLREAASSNNSIKVASSPYRRR
jgi:hypothetical protein